MIGEATMKIRVLSQPRQRMTTDAQTTEFPVAIAADGEAVITYTVHYSW